MDIGIKFMEKNKQLLEETLKTLERLQKEAIEIKIPEYDLILLYQYPTAKVNLFYERVEKLFKIEFKERPDTLYEMARLILSKTNHKNWWE